MGKKTEKTPSVILDTLVGQIKARLKKVDDYRVSAAVLIHEARELVNEGAAGEGVKWSEWAPKQFKIGYREVKRLAFIGAAPSPEAAMEDYREAEATRMKELRAAKKAAPPPAPPEKEAEPPEFTEGDFVVEDDDALDGIMEIPERMDEEEAEQLRIWNTCVRNFVSLPHTRRRQFIQWAMGLCVEPGADEDLLDIPAFLRRK